MPYNGLLADYVNTGTTPEQIEQLLKCLHGECYLCKHGEQYYKAHGVKKYKNTKLTACRIGQQGENITATMRNKDCKDWELRRDFTDYIEQESE